MYCSGRGAVITVSSAASVIPTPLVLVYAATKVCRHSLSEIQQTCNEMVFFSRRVIDRWNQISVWWMRQTFLKITCKYLRNDDGFFSRF